MGSNRSNCRWIYCMDCFYWNISYVRKSFGPLQCKWMNEWTNKRANRRICTRDYYWETSILLFQQSISIEGVSACCATNPLKLHFQLFLGNVKLISIQYFSTWNQLDWFLGWIKRKNIVEKWLHALIYVIAFIFVGFIYLFICNMLCLSIVNAFVMQSFFFGAKRKIDSHFKYVTGLKSINAWF